MMESNGNNMGGRTEEESSRERNKEWVETGRHTKVGAGRGGHTGRGRNACRQSQSVVQQSPARASATRPTTRLGQVLASPSVPGEQPPALTFLARPHILRPALTSSGFKTIKVFFLQRTRPTQPQIMWSDRPSSSNRRKGFGGARGTSNPQGDFPITRPSRHSQEAVPAPHAACGARTQEQDNINSNGRTKKQQSRRDKTHGAQTWS